MASASLRISTFNLLIVILGLFSAPVVFADEVSEIAQDKEIDAKAYDVKTIRPSRSGRVYLFQIQKSDDSVPVDGKIFLLRLGDRPVMAFRVLKTYGDTKRVAAKKLLPYEGFPSLDRGSEYRAYEKIGDKVVPVPATPEDLKDLKELEAGSLEELPPAPQENGEPPAEQPPAESPPAEQLPAETPQPEVPPVETPPPEEGSQAFSREESPELKDTEEEDEADEIGSYFPNFFTMSVGLLNNTTVPGPNPKFGGGLAYSRTFGRSLGSSFAAEGGFYYYKSAGEVNGTLISTTIIPLIGTVRYQVQYSDLWTGYAYAGGVYTYAASNVGASNRQLGQIEVLTPAFGVGAFLQTGPNWYMRFNLGYESITLGVTLRF